METNNTYLDFDSGILAQESVSELLTVTRKKNKNDNENYTITIKTDTERLNSLIRDFDNYANRLKVKEIYFLNALRNLIKKNNFLQLTMQLVENQITEDEYSKQIEAHPESFIVNIEQLDNINDIEIIIEIIKKIGLSFSIDEVSEIFSIDLDNYNDRIKELK